MCSVTENKVFQTIDGMTPLTPEELAYEANLIGGAVSSSDYPERIMGEHCECSDGGEFVLSPLDNPSVQEGGKRYMQCRKCGQWSHL